MSFVTAGSWTSRGGMLDSHFWNIHCEKSDAFVYGNCIEDCRYDHFRGMYQSRMIEVADGGADNVFTDFHGYRANAFNDQLDPVLRIGPGSVLRDFDITDYTPDPLNPRTGALFRGNDNNCVLRDGRFYTKVRPNQMISIENPSVTVENVAIHVKPGVMTGDAIRLLDTNNTRITNFRIQGHTGYESGKSTLRVRTAVSLCRLDNIHDLYGGVIWQDTAPSNAQVSFGYLSWAP